MCYNDELYHYGTIMACKTKSKSSKGGCKKGKGGRKG